MAWPVGNRQHGDEGVHLGVPPRGARRSPEWQCCRKGVRAEADPPAFREEPRWAKKNQGTPPVAGGGGGGGGTEGRGVS